MEKFFRIILPQYKEIMRIPDYFARLLDDQTGTAANTVLISSPIGTIWHVGLSRDSTNTYFTRGWPEFIEAHDMQIGYLMVFSYEGKSKFSVEIFDKSTCLKEYGCSSDVLLDAAAPGNNPSDFDTGYDGGKSEYKEWNDSENSNTSSEAPVPSKVDKKTQNLDSSIKLRSGAVVHKGIKQRGRRSNNKSKPPKNVGSNALTTKGWIFKTIRENYNLSYMPLKKWFCDNSPYKLSNDIVIVKTETSKKYPVKYRVCGNYNFLGRGWRKFCEENDIQIGDRCQIRITGDNELLVKFNRP